MEILHLLGTIVYFAMLIGLSVYGCHRYVMLYLYYKYRKNVPAPPGRFATLPKITVQLPLYNEMYVAERLLDSISALDYPKDKLEIQVLDDSTDETTGITAHKVAELRAKGFDIAHVHRTNRQGYKAGALENGLQTATGEYIAIFDADFLPTPDLLQRLIHYFTDSKIGMIQTRWGHINEKYSLLTRVQSMFLDGHFLIEQTARARSGRFFNFNGTGGIWRRSCIEESGGWSHDTLAEDLDLSYRAQIKGWKFLYLPDVTTPAELPVEMAAFKSQQHRWAKGSIQAGKKMLPALWRAKVPLKVKIEGTVHLTSNFGHLMLLIMCLVFHSSASLSTYHATGGNAWTKLFLVDMPLFFAATVSMSAFYLCAQIELHEKWWKQLLLLPVLMAVGLGMSLNNARAVLEAIFNHKSEFVRTPKFGVRERKDSWSKTKYRAWRGIIPYLEICFGLYFSVLLVRAADNAQWTSLPFLFIFQIGFFYVGVMSLMQSRSRLMRREHEVLAPASA